MSSGFVKFIEGDKRKSADFYFPTNTQTIHYSSMLNCGTAEQKKILAILSDSVDKKNTDENAVYVDIGCQSGESTIAYAKYFNIKPENAYCFDDVDQSPLIKSMRYNYKKISYEDISSFVLPSIDILTFNFSIAKIKRSQYVMFFQMLKKYMKPHCITIVRDYDMTLELYNTKIRNYIIELRKMEAILHGENKLDSYDNMKFISFSDVKEFFIITLSVVKKYKIDDSEEILRPYYAVFEKYGTSYQLK